MLLLTIFLLLQSPPMILFDFTTTADISAWRTVDDTVMGGRSDGRFRLNEAGHGEYSGHVSLENNGGFSSLRYRMPTIKIAGMTTVILRLKGDGKRYQFRTKTSTADRHSYVTYFATTGEWQEITLDLTTMKPQFRGRALDLPDYPAEMLSEIAFLIGNKEEQDFRLVLDWIRLE